MVTQTFWQAAYSTFIWAWWVFLALSPILLILGLWIYRKLLMRYPLEAVIFERRGDNLVWTRDRIGRFEDAGIHKYKLKKAKDTIPIMDYEWVLHATFKPTNIFERFSNLIGGTTGAVLLYKYGSKQYKPINTKLPGKEVIEYQEIENEGGENTFIQIYKQINPHKKLADLNFVVIDWDNINFMVQEQRAIDERRKKKNQWLMTYGIPILIIGVSALIFIFSVYFATDIVSQGMAGGGSLKQGGATTPEIPIISDILTPGG